MAPSPQFLNLPKEKRDEILIASLREFAERGFDLASTNQIVKQADISKGVLFKYFDDKESLFLYVFETMLEDALSTFSVQQVAAFDDVFDWIKHTTKERIQFSIERPLTYRLFMRVAKEPQHPIYSKVLAISAGFANRYRAQLAGALPADRLREGVTWDGILAMVSLISQGLSDKYIAVLPDEAGANLEEFYRPLMEELDKYLDVVKFGAYRPLTEGGEGAQ